MLPKKYRLPAQIKFDNPKSVFNPFVSVLIKDNNLSHNRFGFVISKKVDKRAVVRNKIRRMLSEYIKEFVETGKGWDILFLVKKDFTETPTGVESMIKETMLKFLKEG